MQKLVPLSKVKANPFRRLERYPINQEKIATLEVSINETGFWDNVVAREVNGFYELAYGHHRRIAFENLYGSDAKIWLIIKEIPDDIMLKIMANENMQEWGTSAIIEQETIWSVVTAYAENKIDLWKKWEDKKKTRPIITDHELRLIRNAPSFLPLRPGKKGDLKTQNHDLILRKPYNALAIADFLGWMKPSGQPSPRVSNALAALEAIESDLVPKEVMETPGLGSAHAKAIVEGAKQIEREYGYLEEKESDPQKAEEIRKRGKEKIKETARKVSKAVNVLGVRGIREEMDTVAKTFKKEKSKLPTPVMDYCTDIALELNKVLDVDYTSWRMFTELVKHKDEIDSEAMRNITSALNKLVKRAQDFIEALKPTPAQEKVKPKVSTNGKAHKVITYSNN